MTKEEFIENIEEDIRWRVGEFASFKALPVQYGMNENHRQIVMTYFIPAIYAIWEGFVVNIMRNFIKFINEQRISIDKLHNSILTHALQSEFKFNESRTSLESQRNLVRKIYEKFNAEFNISTKVQTESNINYKVLSNILDSLNLSLPEIKYKSSLNKLLQFRNSIAHGESALPVSATLINEFTKNIEDLMGEIFLICIDGIDNEVYRVAP